MENHPIPQDVTNFQFKLIGNMTVKQFAYLATGSVLAWFFFSIPLFPIIKIPLAVLFFSLGASFAFLPIEGRTCDTMLLFFLKSLFTPNQYIFQKTGIQILPILPPYKKPKKENKKAPEKTMLEEYLKKMQKEKKRGNKLDQKEMVFFESLSSIMSTLQTAAVPSEPPRLISIEEEEKKKLEMEDDRKTDQEPNIVQKEKFEALELEKEALEIKKELLKVKKQEDQKEEEPSTLHQKVTDLERQLDEVLRQREKLEKDLLILQKKFEEQHVKTFAPSFGMPKEQTQNVRQVPKDMGKSIGLPIAPDSPNVIMGIIKDPRGNVLPNILVEVKDKDGNPVRAFKTNALGQFASATPLLNGVYTIWFEDPNGKNKFDTIEITANGEIISPIEVNSVDEREELRKALFN